MSPLEIATYCLLSMAAGFALGWAYGLWITRPKSDIDSQIASLQHKADHSAKTRPRLKAYPLKETS